MRTGPAKIVLQRNARHSGRWLRFRVDLDGVERGGVGNGGEWSASVPAGPHTLRVRASRWMPGESIDFEAVPDGTTRLRVEPFGDGLSLWDEDVPGAGPRQATPLPVRSAVRGMAWTVVAILGVVALGRWAGIELRVTGFLPGVVLSQWWVRPVARRGRAVLVGLVVVVGCAGAVAAVLRPVLPEDLALSAGAAVGALAGGVVFALATHPWPPWRHSPW